MDTTIKHLVISGGGPLILNLYGALKQSNILEMWSHTNIKSYHGTSAGAMLTTFMALKYEWEELDNYIINRPWHNIMNFNVLNIYDYYTNNGIMDKTFIYEMFSPVLKAKDIEIDVDMETFCQITGVSIYLYATEYSTFEMKEFSAEATPRVKMLDAVYASMAIPILFKPIKIENRLYLDGSILINNPMEKCVERNEDLTTILGIRHELAKKMTKTDDSTDFDMLHYVTNTMNKLINKMQIDSTDANIKEVIVHSKIEDLANFFKLANSCEDRKKVIECGMQDAINWLKPN
jgi:predicted acylesterase/phospholipase RssA